MYLLSFLADLSIAVDMMLESFIFFQKGTYLNRDGDFEGIFEN